MPGGFLPQKVNKDIQLQVPTGILTQLLCPPPPPGFDLGFACVECLRLLALVQPFFLSTNWVGGERGRFKN